MRLPVHATTGTCHYRYMPLPGFTALRVERLSNGETVFVDVVPGDQAVLDREVQGEPRTIRAPGGPGGLADLAEHDRIIAIDEDALDLGGLLPGHMVCRELTVVIGGVAACAPMPDPWGGSVAV